MSWGMTWDMEQGTSFASWLQRALERPPADVVRPTGGVAQPETRAAATGSIDAIYEQTAPVEFPLRPADLIAQIRASLSLNISELATVMHVERPTIYAWIAGSATPQSSNLRRLAEIAGWAREWSRLSRSPVGPAVRQQGPGAMTLVEVLADEAAATVGVRSFLNALVVAQAAAMAEATPRGLRARGVPLVEKADGRAEIDRITGRRLAPEE